MPQKNLSLHSKGSVTDMWEILGIEPTPDLKAIKSAYAKLAKQYNHEEHPEEFQRIYAAYKRACIFAKAAGKTDASDVRENEKVTNAPTEECKPSELLRFDFSSVDIFPDYDLPIEKRFEKMLDNMKALLADDARSDSIDEWLWIFQKDDFDLFAENKDFRASADKLLSKKLFSPETASAIARVFGHGTRAVPCGKSRSGQEQWKLWIPEGGRRPPKGYKMPSYMDTSPSNGAVYDNINDILKVIIVLILIIFFANLPAIINLICERNDIPEPAETSSTTQTADMGGATVYLDENGQIIGKA